jgi:hypothetical protein
MTVTNVQQQDARAVAIDAAIVAAIRLHAPEFEAAYLGDDLLPPAERCTYIKRLDELRSRGRNVGWAVEEEFNSLWYAAALDEHHGE